MSDATQRAILAMRNISENLERSRREAAERQYRPPQLQHRPPPQQLQQRPRSMHPPHFQPGPPILFSPPPPPPFIDFTAPLPPLEDGEVDAKLQRVVVKQEPLDVVVVKSEIKPDESIPMQSDEAAEPQMDDSDEQVPTVPAASEEDAPGDEPALGTDFGTPQDDAADTPVPVVAAAVEMTVEESVEAAVDCPSDVPIVPAAVEMTAEEPLVDEPVVDAALEMMVEEPVEVAVNGSSDVPVVAAAVEMTVEEPLVEEPLSSDIPVVNAAVEMTVEKPLADAAPVVAAPLEMEEPVSNDVPPENDDPIAAVKDDDVLAALETAASLDDDVIAPHPISEEDQHQPEEDHEGHDEVAVENNEAPKEQEREVELNGGPVAQEEEEEPHQEAFDALDLDLPVALDDGWDTLLEDEEDGNWDFDDVAARVDEVGAAVEALEAPALVATRCVSTEDRRKLVAAVSTVFAALSRGDNKDADRLGRALARGTQSRDRIVATAARAARLKLHTKRVRPALTTADVPDSGLRAELEKARSDLADARKQLAAEVDGRAKLQRSLRASFHKAQQQWDKDRAKLQDALTKAQHTARQWQQRAQQATHAAGVEQRKASRALAEQQAIHRQAFSSRIGPGSVTKKKQVQRGSQQSMVTSPAALGRRAPAIATTQRSKQVVQRKRSAAVVEKDEDPIGGGGPPPSTKKRRASSATTAAANMMTSCSRAVAARVTARED